jgi:hypothetical protein
MTKTAQKTQGQNGTAVAMSPEIDLEAAQRAIDEAEQAKQQRFVIEYQRLCEAYGMEVWFRPTVTDDGRIGMIKAIRKAQQ